MEPHDHCGPSPLAPEMHLWLEYSQPAETAPDKAGEVGWALTNILARQASVAGHVDEEDVFASELLEGDVLLPVEGEGSILKDGAAHVRIAVRLQQKTSAREQSELQGNWVSPC